MCIKLWFDTTRPIFSIWGMLFSCYKEWGTNMDRDQIIDEYQKHHAS